MASAAALNTTMVVKATQTMNDRNVMQFNLTIPIPMAVFKLIIFISAIAIAVATASPFVMDAQFRVEVALWLATPAPSTPTMATDPSASLCRVTSHAMHVYDSLEESGDTRLYRKVRQADPHIPRIGGGAAYASVGAGFQANFFAIPVALFRIFSRHSRPFLHLAAASLPHPAIPSAPLRVVASSRSSSMKFYSDPSAPVGPPLPVSPLPASPDQSKFLCLSEVTLTKQVQS
ncbi:hypothetical protein BC830DRAFT_1163714 [Chytriomyces sp. MP71]|nr:hypothetical protein BC830DRAFT_1163714 [Chytriomyces sp. MP71]